MEDVRIILSASWVALMLTYLLGDVLRIYRGNFEAGEIAGTKMTQSRWLGIAVLMVTPIVMVFLSLTLNYPVIRWANIIVAIVFFGFNLIGLPTYRSAYDKFLIIVGLAFNVLTVWYAWTWVQARTALLLMFGEALLCETYSRYVHRQQPGAWASIS